MSSADLVHESEQRAARATATVLSELGLPVPVAVPEMPATLRLPDPYGPDPVVFGPPRVRS